MVWGLSLDRTSKIASLALPALPQNTQSSAPPPLLCAKVFFHLKLWRETKSSEPAYHIIFGFLAAFVARKIFWAVKRSGEKIC